MTGFILLEEYKDKSVFYILQTLIILMKIIFN